MLQLYVRIYFTLKLLLFTVKHTLANPGCLLLYLKNVSSKMSLAILRLQREYIFGGQWMGVGQF